MGSGFGDQHHQVNDYCIIRITIGIEAPVRSEKSLVSFATPLAMAPVRAELGRGFAWRHEANHIIPTKPRSVSNLFITIYLARLSRRLGPVLARSAMKSTL